MTDEIARPRIDPAVTPFERTAAFRRYGLAPDPDPAAPESLYLKAMLREQGFDGLPHVVARQQLDRYAASGEAEMFRGVTDARFAEQVRSGDFFVGRGGLADGMYAAARPHGLAVAREFAGGAGGVVLRMTLRSGARIIESRDLEARAGEELERHVWALRAEQAAAIRAAARGGDQAALERIASGYDHRLASARLLYNHLGLYAAYLGYDAIHIAELPAPESYVILNRTAVRVQRENIR